VRNQRQAPTKGRMKYLQVLIAFGTKNKFSCNINQRPSSINVRRFIVPIHIPTHYYARTITKTLHITNARRTPSPFPLRDSSIIFMLWSKRDAQLARVELIDFSSFFIKDVFSSMLINLLFLVPSTPISVFSVVNSNQFYSMHIM
jgi:hypothetical protein